MDYKSGIRVEDHTCNGHCSGCGECCGNFLPMSADEVAAIHRHLKRHPVREQRHNAMMGVDATCPFRDEKTRKCLIYSIRPGICRSFMCNYTLDDLATNKELFHKKNTVVDLRREFFGNGECDFIMDAYRMEGWK